MKHRIYRSIVLEPCQDGIVVRIKRDFRWGKGNEDDPYVVCNSYAVKSITRLSTILRAWMSAVPEISGVKSSSIGIE